MITNSMYTPPSYAINLTPVYKDVIVYMSSYDTCNIYIGKQSNGELKAKEKIVLQRQNDNTWSIVSRETLNDFSIDGVSNPYYTYSNYIVGAQMPTQYYYKEMGFYAKGIFIMIVAYLIGRTILKIIGR